MLATLYVITDYKEDTTSIPYLQINNLWQRKLLVQDHISNT